MSHTKIENLPAAFANEKRFFAVGKTKGSVPKAWNDPQNQMTAAQAFKASTVGNVGVDVCGHGVRPDYLFVDFDNVLDDGGEFVTDDARRWYNYLSMTGTYCEKSVSGHGLHFMFKPTAGKFKTISNSKDCVIQLSSDNSDVKIELFYATAARYCLLTGNMFNCAAKTPIVEGSVADEVFQQLLNEIARQHPARLATEEPRHNQRSDDEADKNFNFYYAQELLKKLAKAKHEDVTYNQWLAANSASKALGIPYPVVDELFNRHDPSGSYNAEQNEKRWQGLETEGYGIATLVGLAKKVLGLTKDDVKAIRRKVCREHPELKKKLNAHSPVDDKDASALTAADLKKFLSGGSTDVENALRLEKFLRDKVKWLEDDEYWLTWRGGVWHKRSNSKGVVYPHVFNLATRAKKAMQILGDDNDLGKKKKWAKIYAFEDTRTANRAIAALTACKTIRITADDLDNHPNLLCVKNGVIDLREGKLYDADPNLLLTQQAPVAFDPQADTAAFNNFFADIMPNEETRAGLLRWLGYCLTGDVREEKFMIWLGSGANGKGVLSRAMSALLGDYAATLPRTALATRFIENTGHTADLMPLVGARFSISEEIAQNATLDGAWLKTLSGGDLLRLSAKFKDFVTVKPTAKINFSSNYIPKIENVADDAGMKRRLLIMPFTQTFTGARCNPQLKLFLLDPKNLRGLLRILVREARAWYTDADADRSGLIISDEMTTATKENIEANDFLSDALDEFFERDVNASALRRAVLDLLKDKIPRARRYSDRDLTKMIEARGFEYDRGENGMRFKGLRFKDPVDELGGKNIDKKDIACP